MDQRGIAAALERASGVMKLRPSAGLHADTTAIARWDGGLRVVSEHESGFAVVTDLPRELGGAGDRVSPGWLVRSGLASCVTTFIAMAAAREGVVLDALSVEASSRSDLRGVLGVAERDGSVVPAGMRDITLRVRVSATGIPVERLRALVSSACRSSPMSQVVERPSDITFDIDATVDAAAA